MLIQSLFKNTVFNNNNNFDQQIDNNLSTLLDNAPIDEAINIINDCESFLQISNNTLLSLPFPAFNRLRNWRVKRRDNKLAIMYDSLLPRLQINEQCLRSLLSDVIEKRNALRLQGYHLLRRLNSCIIYNQIYLEQSIEPLEQYREIVNILSSESAYVKSMVNFNSDILRCQHVELVSNGKGYLPWNNKQINVMSYGKASSIVRGALRPVTENDLECDEDHPELMYRLKLLRENKQKFVDLLSELLQKRETYLVNMSNSQESFQQLTKLLKRDDRGLGNRPKDKLDYEIEKELSSKSYKNKSVNKLDSKIDSKVDDKVENSIDSKSVGKIDSVSINESDSRIVNTIDTYNNSLQTHNELTEELTIEVESSYPYDHSRCTDCSLGNYITKDCINNLQLLYQQAKLATEKLQAIVEYREKLNEIAETLELNNIISDENDLNGSTYDGTNSPKSNNISKSNNIQSPSNNNLLFINSFNHMKLFSNMTSFQTKSNDNNQTDS